MTGRLPVLEAAAGSAGSIRTTSRGMLASATCNRQYAQVRSLTIPAPVGGWIDNSQFTLAARIRLLRRAESLRVDVTLQRSTNVADEISEKVIQIVCDQMGVSQEKVQDATHFINDLGADSLDTVELVMEFEDQFDISIPDEDAEKIQTVGDAITYIKGKKG